MPSMTNRQSVAANAIISNVFSDQVHYRLKQPSRILFLASAAAIGMHTSLIIGDELFLDDMEVSAQNRMPIFPDDLVVEAAGRVNDEIIERLRNTTGAAIVAFSRVDIIPM